MNKYVLFLFFAFHVSVAYSSENNTFYLVSMGDSITSAFNTRWVGGVGNKRYNWSTGVSQRVASHFNRLDTTKSSLRIKFRNVAVTGAKSAGLQDQLRRAEENRIDYLTILIGANDVCSWSEDHKDAKQSFKKNVSGIIEKVVAKNNKVKILLSSIPDMNHLYEKGKNKCQFKWDLFKICPRLLHSKRNDEERREFYSRLVDANKVLEELSAEYDSHVKFVADVFAFKFSIDHLSPIDCFHPSIKGQDALADMTWNKGWFF